MWISSMRMIGAFGRDAELVLGVDEDEAVLRGALLAEGEEFESLRRGEVPLVWGEPVFGDDFAGSDGAVVRGLFGGRRDEVARELFVLAHAFGERDVGEGALARTVLRPDGGVGRSGEVAAHDELNRQDAAFAREQSVGVRRADDVIRDDVTRGFKPVQRGAVEHLALVGNRAEHAVEAGLSVGGDE